MDLQLFAQEPTEAATPRRRQEARQRGQVAKSVELVSAITLLATYLVLKTAGPYMAGKLLNFTHNLWGQGASQDWSEAGVRSLFLNVIVLLAMIISPLLIGAMVAGLVANYLQVGFLFTLQPLAPKFERINPAAGFKRIFSTRTLVELAKSIAKMLLIGYIAYRTVADDLIYFPRLLEMKLPQVTLFLSDLVSRMLLWVGLSMLVLALVDFFYQRYEYDKSIRMTKHELKQEFRQTEGNPEIRAKIKQKQREMSRKRMMQDIKKADVVVTNPTHYAVALQYQREQMNAPQVIAKGQGLVALRIRELAKEHQVPIVENPPLARQLHKLAAVGREVPPDLFQAVAEVLAFIYQLKQKGY